MSELELTAALTVNERTRPLLNGDVRPAGIRLLLSPMESAQMFWRQLEFAEFDVSEMSISGLSAAVSRGDDRWWALPIFTVRRFYHTQLLVRADAGIERPEDLRGKRAGVPEYVQTSVVWARGILADQFGVKPADLEWFMERSADRSLGGATQFQPPPGLRFSYLADSQSLDRMLLDGELDVLFHYITARNLVDRSRADLGSDRRVRPLFPDVAAESARYYAQTSIYPVNHCVVVRRSIVERYPWVALNLFDAFQAAAEMVRRRSFETLAPYFAAGLVDRHLHGVLARDPWAYGIAAARPALDTLLRYLETQQLLARPVRIDELFAPSTLGL
jgi:4,5-dihydroxyphthalate decarboxylase